MRKSYLIIFFLLPFIAYTQDTLKRVNAVRSNEAIKLDGVPDDAAWKTAPLISGFIEMRPNFGKPEDPATRTEVYLLYDDHAIYFGGTLYEQKENIATQLVGRDLVGANDFIGITFDTYQDRINGMGFYVTALNEQADLKYSIGMNNGEDYSWNAVYETETRINETNWTFEMRIPYSAIRFSKEKIQNWNIHIIRRRTKTGQQFSWSPIDPTKFGFMNQAGVWAGLRDIKPPIRLSISPYFSTYLTRNAATDKEWNTTVNGGMDLKYGLTDGFTMDMTLIPDFGQVQSDNQILNLSPFEVKFNENRQFFTEGIELFNKGDLFYSRRIGGVPLHYNRVSSMVQPGEQLLKNPAESKLINATKISGRTKKKLGIGFFNAITKAQHATIQDTNGGKYDLQTDPLTNYNITVIDQGLKNNSRVTLINTNVWRSGSDYDANVTALDWDLYDNNIAWNAWGQVNHSRLTGYEAPGKTTKGYLYNLFVGYFKGRFNWEVHRFFADEKYEQRDLGYFTNNNYVSHGGYMSFKWVKPRGFYNNITTNLNWNYSQRYIPRRYQSFRVNSNIRSQLKNLWNAGINFDIRPGSNDYYESRMEGRIVKMPSSWMKGFWINTNQAKKYTANFELYHRSSAKYNTSSFEFRVGNNYRFNDKLSIGLNHSTDFSNRSFGFAYITEVGDSVIMSVRNRRTAENIFNVRYNFNNRMGLSFRLRHYWSKVDYYRFFNLEQDGNVTELAASSQNPDINVNLFNIDMNYTWQFAPGSFINLNWKTASELFDQYIQERYYNNLKKTIDSPQLTNFSVKVIYYLDYLDLKRKKK